MDSNKSPQQLCAHLQGQIAMLGVAVHALLKTHPQQGQAAQQIREGAEQLLTAYLNSSLPDETSAGIDSMLRTYLLKSPPDPGQPRRA